MVIDEKEGGDILWEKVCRRFLMGGKLISDLGLDSILFSDEGKVFRISGLSKESPCETIFTTSTQDVVLAQIIERVYSILSKKHICIRNL